jgi:hypothetical protein
LNKIAFNFGNIESIETLIASLEGGLFILSESALNKNTVAEETKEWTEKTLKILKKQSPTSLKVTLQLFKNSANVYNHDLKKCLTVEYGLMMKLLRRADFKEGVSYVYIYKHIYMYIGNVDGCIDKCIRNPIPLNRNSIPLNPIP